MWFLFLIAAIAGPAVVFYFARRGEDLRREQAQPVSGLADGEWPSVGLIIPAAGTPRYGKFYPLTAFPELFRHC